jgi:membrane associated rhomboid family serine protease
MTRLTDVVKNLLLLNVIVFLAVILDNAAGQPLALESLLALHYPESDKFLPVQLVTHFFMHGGLLHLFFNMFALIIFGPPLEVRWGPQRFLLYYLICAFGSAALHLAWNYWDFSSMQATIDQFMANPDLSLFNTYVAEIPLGGLRMDGGASATAFVSELRSAMLDDGISAVEAQRAAQFMEEWRQFKMNIPVVGASGAIYGLLLAFGTKFPNVRLYLLFLPVPIKAKFLIPIMLVIELFLGFQQYDWDNMAHFAHLGGALAGFLLILYWRNFSRNP